MFVKEALVGNFRDITTFEKAYEVLDFHYDAIIFDVTIAAMLKLDSSLNLGYDMHFTKNPRNFFLYYPYNPLVTIPEGTTKKCSTLVFFK